MKKPDMFSRRRQEQGQEISTDCKAQCFVDSNHSRQEHTVRLLDLLRGRLLRIQKDLECNSVFSLEASAVFLLCNPIYEIVLVNWQRV